MTKANTNSSSRRNSGKGGRAVKTDNGAGNIAPEGNTTEQTVEQPQKVADAIVAEAGSEPTEVAPAESPAAEVTEQSAEQPVVGDGVADSQSVEQPVADEGTTEQPVDGEVAQTAEAAAVRVDPFADLPMTTIDDYQFRDLATADTSDPRKYTEVQKAALEGKLPIKPNWKHSAAMITTGRVQREFREGSVYGTIDQIVRSYGRAGVPAYVLVPAVRQAQIGNKRSHYCTSLPPIGWAEGWIDTYISKGHGKVMEKKAPVLTAEVKAEILEGQVQAEADAAKLAA